MRTDFFPEVKDGDGDTPDPLACIPGMGEARRNRAKRDQSDCVRRCSPTQKMERGVWGEEFWATDLKKQTAIRSECNAPAPKSFLDDCRAASRCRRLMGTSLRDIPNMFSPAGSHTTAHPHSPHRARVSFISSHRIFPYYHTPATRSRTTRKRVCVQRLFTLYSLERNNRDPMPKHGVTRSCQPPPAGGRRCRAAPANWQVPRATRS